MSTGGKSLNTAPPTDREKNDYYFNKTRHYGRINMITFIDFRTSKRFVFRLILEIHKSFNRTPRPYIIQTLEFKSARLYPCRTHGSWPTSVIKERLMIHLRVRTPAQPVRGRDLFQEIVIFDNIFESFSPHTLGGNHETLIIMNVVKMKNIVAPRNNKIIIGL